MSDDNKPEPFANGRYGNGQFAPGNRFAAGHGNPHAEKVAAWRKTLTETIEPRHIEAAVKVLLRNALEGKGWALRELFDRCFGRPPQAVDLQGYLTGLQAAVPREAVELPRAFLAWLDERAEGGAS